MAGCNVLASVERDPNAIEVYRTNFPNTRLWDSDITLLDPLRLLAQAGLQPRELDILDGSPPCQGFSMVGKRQVNDPRNQLFLEYVRFLKAIQPKTFVMENVPGLVAGSMKGIFQEMIQTLSEQGYEVRARILNAAHYGVPQCRRRLIVIGFRNDLGIIPLHPQPNSLPVTFRQAVSGLSDHDLLIHPTGQALKLAKALRPGECGADLHQRFAQKGNDFSLIRLAWDKPSPTVCKTIRPGQCGLLHPDEDRFLSIGELKRVCSFPDDFELLGSFEARWGRLGNAVPPLLTKVNAESVIKQLGGM
jgi:DNA (cytosine-5)-methyltransferase 1